MKIFEEMEKRGHEELIFSYIDDVDLKLMIGIHDTTLGRTLGGLRMKNYINEENAISEVLKLSEIQTYQCAAADIDSGGSTVLAIGNPKSDKTESYFRAIGRLIESLKGRVYIFPDLGTDSADFKYIQRETDYTIFKNRIKDNQKISAEITANGVYWGIKACAKFKFGTSSLSGLTFSIQGLGKVGKQIVDFLKSEEDVHIIVTDLAYDNIKEVNDKYPDIEVVKPEEILEKKVDCFVPCASGFIINEKNIDSLKCKIIAGAAYNIFTDESLIKKIHEKDILYAPDFIIAAGDSFLVDDELKLSDVVKAKEDTQIIYNVMLNILNSAKIKNITPYEHAIELAIDRYEKIDKIKNILC